MLVHLVPDLADDAEITISGRDLKFLNSLRQALGDLSKPITQHDHALWLYKLSSIVEAADDSKGAWLVEAGFEVLGVFSSRQEAVDYCKDNDYDWGFSGDNCFHPVLISRF